MNKQNCPAQQKAALMITDAHVKNFRGIRSAELRNLKRINVLVGPNGSGKTAFLEAIYVALGGSQELLLRTKGWRGREQAMQMTDNVHDALWADTFRDSEIGKATIVLTGDEKETRSVVIEKQTPSVTISPDGQERSTSMGLTFKYQSPTLGEQVSQTSFGPAGFQIVGVPSSSTVHFMAARSHASEQETANLFSQLEIKGESDTFVEPFLKEFSVLKKVGPLSPFGTQALYGYMAAGQVLPLSMISGGINHLAGIMVRIVANKRCVMIIDEIENGFYHERYEAIWRMLFDLIENVDGQIFASTHSLECLRTIVPALSDKMSEVAVIRARLDDKYEPTFKIIKGDVVAQSLENGDIR